jgi:hypothetical protein
MARHGRFTEHQERKHMQRHDEQRERQRTRKQKMLADYAAANALFKPAPIRYGDTPKEK